MKRVLLLTAILAGLMTTLPLVQPAEASTYTVLNATDSGLGSLRHAMLNAQNHQGADIIVFDAAYFATPRTINLASKLPLITDDLIIYGPGKQKLTINASGCNACSIFETDSSPEVTVGSMTLTGATRGAVRLAWAGQMTLADVIVTGNTIAGGVVVEGGWMWIYDSTISGNTSRGNGGGITNFNGALKVERSTLSGNSAGGNGGGLYAVNETWDFVQSTISNNTALRGGGVYVEGPAWGEIRNTAVYENRALVAGGGSQLAVERDVQYLYNLPIIQVENSIIAQGVNGNAPLCWSQGTYGAMHSEGTNIFSDNGCAGLFAPQPSDRLNTDPQLGPLADNGGPTKTHLPLTSSPAIDTGADCGPTDQRGQPRPADGSSAIPGAICDVGPVEVQPSR